MPKSRERSQEDDGELLFDWATLVPFVVHPMRVAMIEALRWIGEPLSASDFEALFFAEEISTSMASYHLVELARAGAVAKVSERQIRGAVKKSYFLAKPATRHVHDG